MRKDKLGGIRELEGLPCLAKNAIFLLSDFIQPLPSSSRPKPVEIRNERIKLRAPTHGEEAKPPNHYLSYREELLLTLTVQFELSDIQPFLRYF